MNADLESAMQAVIEAQRRIWLAWQKTPNEDPAEERLDFANGELINIIEDLKPFSDAAQNWRGPWTWI